MSRRIQSKSELRQKKESYLQNFSSRLDDLSKRVCLVLVAPKYQGNIGAVARLMKNSGLTDLRLVNPPEIQDEAYARSMGGKDILMNARIYRDFRESVSDCSVVAATSSEQTLSDRKFLRLPTTPQGFWENYLAGRNSIALVFGREDDGLRNEEIELCNAFIHIPANPKYPVYNLSHAVSILLYEMIRNIPESDPAIPDPIRPDEMTILVERIQETLQKFGYPEYKMENGMVMIKRILGRANLTESEYYKIMGMIRFVLAPWSYDNGDDHSG